MKKDEFLKLLEEYYPEKEIFSLDAISRTLRKYLSDVYVVEGYTSDTEFLQSHGFKMISSEEYKVKHPKIIYKRGDEPPCIKKIVDSAICSLNEFYPNKIINVDLKAEHHKLYEKISALTIYLGYFDINEFLNSYGFEADVKRKAPGRQKKNYDEYILELKNRYYENKADNLKQIIDENPNINSCLKTLMNTSNTRFGTSLTEYLIKEGIIVSKDELIKRREKEKQDRMDAKKAERKMNELTQKRDKQDSKKVTAQDPKEKYLKSINLRREREVLKRHEMARIKENAEKKGYDIYFRNNSIDSISIVKYHGNEVNVIIPESFSGGLVQGIGRYSFSSDRIETIVIPDSVRYVDNFSFYECENLKKVWLGKNVEWIKRLQNGNLLDIGMSCLNKNYFIQSGLLIELKTHKVIAPAKYQERYIIPDDIEIIDSYAFYKTGIKEVIFGNNLKRIEKYAFFNNPELTIRNIPEAIETIDKNAFDPFVRLLDTSYAIIDRFPCFNKANDIGCIICDVWGDQAYEWYQTVTVRYCSISLNDALLLFEIHNRYYNEYYEDLGIDYLGLDNLEKDVLFARKKRWSSMKEGMDYSSEDIEQTEFFKKMVQNYPERYGCLKKYVDKMINDYDEDTLNFGFLSSCFETYTLFAKTYYWVSEQRVTAQEYKDYAPDGFYHSYRVLELYEYGKFPYNFDDIEIVTPFGSKELLDLADMDYGC